MEKAESNRRFGERTIVFVDEIHRFNKAQQDAFLPFVEKGSIILIGATTENPSFEVNGALLSRCKVFVLQSLKVEDLVLLLERALKDERGFGGDRGPHRAGDARGHRHVRQRRRRAAPFRRWRWSCSTARWMNAASP